MLNKDRIRLMTQLAAYEQREGKENAAMSQYYRRDYVSLQMLKTLLYSTISYAILFIMQVLYRLDSWLESLYTLDYQEYITDILVKYLIFVLVYQAVAWGVYNLRYRKGTKEQKLYLGKLRKVEKLYEREEKLVLPEEWDD